jgi:hypothetical protein
MFDHTLSTSAIGDVFAEEIGRQSGRVTDTFDDGTRLFVRSILLKTDKVRPKDLVQSGVALKATPDGICVYPYVFREVCRNGAIMAHSLGARRLLGLEDQTPEETLSSVREAVAACCSEGVFAESVAHFRESLQGEVDFALTMLSLMRRLPDSVSRAVMPQILDQFFRDGDRSRYGLVNAITAVARDRSDPDERWDLEELGGGVAANKISPMPHDATERGIAFGEMAQVG